VEDKGRGVGSSLENPEMLVRLFSKTSESAMNRPGGRFYLIDAFRIDVSERLLFKENHQQRVAHAIFPEDLTANSQLAIRNQNSPKFNPSGQGVFAAAIGAFWSDEKGGKA